MSGDGILGIFQGYPFFKEFRERHLMSLAAGAKPFSLKPGEYLAKQGSSGSGLYMIQSGKIAIEMSRGAEKSTVRLQEVGPGDLVGWSWLVPPHRWQFDCLALTDVQGLGFDGNWLRDKCDQDHELGYHILKQMITVMYSRGAATRTQLLDMYK